MPKRRRTESSNQAVPWKPYGAKKKAASFRGRNFAQTPINAITYKGPFNSPALMEASDLHTFVLVFNGTIASDGTGKIATVFDGYSQASSAADWAGLSGLFKEYRILGFKVIYSPWNQYSKATTVVTAPVRSIVDRTSSTALTSLSDASSYSSCKIHSLENPFSRSVRMDGVDESQWILSGGSPATTSRLYIKLFSNGLSNTITYGDYTSYIVVQFRGL